MKKWSYIILINLFLIQLSASITLNGYPYIAYSGETKLMVGAFAFAKYTFDFQCQNEFEPEVSLLSNAIYTQKKQFLVVLVPEYNDPLWGLKYSSDIYLRLWPSEFYGIGNNTDKSVSEGFVSEQYALETTITKRMYKDFYLSAKSSLGHHRLREIEAGGIIDNMEFVGKDPSFYSGLGYKLMYSSTDNENYPTKGMRISFQQIYYHSVLGSDFDYTEHKYDFRTYSPIGDKMVFATQTDLAVNDGNTPFYNYLELGNRLRAYDSKRYIDKVRIAQRIEQRVFPFESGFSKRAGFVIFGEVGQVTPDIDQIRLSEWHWSAGFGFRFSILPNERLNTRMDFGFGSDSFNFIVNAREVF